MKKTVLAFVLLASLTVIPAMAQEVDFTSERSQFLYFSLGIPMGFSLEAEDVYSGVNFGIGFVVLDNLTVGFDRIALPNVFTANMLRIGYFLTDTVGATMGIGSGSGLNDTGTLLTNQTAVTFGVMANLFQARSNIGLMHSLRVRAEYAAIPEYFASGNLIFTLGVTFGL